MYGIDGRLSNNTKKPKQIIDRKKCKPNPKEERMFVSGNRKSNRWVVWTTRWETFHTNMYGSDGRLSTITQQNPERKERRQM